MSLKMEDGVLHVVTISPTDFCSQRKKTFEQAVKSFHEGMKGNGKELVTVKVAGEDKLVSVVDGGTASILDALNRDCGDQIQISCVPCRPYENLGVQLELDEEHITPPPTKLETTDSNMLVWLQFNINFLGMKMKEFLEIYKKEMEAIFKARKAGEVFLGYKRVASFEIHFFWIVSDYEKLDDFLHDLPVQELLGNQTTVIVKPVEII